MTASALAQANPEREAFFGETHVHTGWSFDAYIFGNTMTGPAEAYAYATGEPIRHPLGYTIKIDTPLDWMGVTDHSEYVGTVRLANDPSSPISKLPIAEKLKVRTKADIQRVYLWLGTSMIDNKPVKELLVPEIAGTVWKENNAIADRYNKPGTFTAFCAYEWTSTPNNRNMHRNVFFKDCAKVPPMPFSSIDSTNPEDLWAWMDGQRKARNELLAISHNANLSDGHMFPTEVDEKGRPIDAAWAESRLRNERLSEIKQIKGQSETHPFLFPNDEFANFEVLTYLLGDPAGRIPHIPGSYIRQAYKDGLSMQGARGYNPYKFGLVGGSDSHNTGVPYRQDNFFGGHAKNDGTAQVRLGNVFAGLDTKFENPAGLTGIWAEENTRASLFEAMQRKETFATSGPRIKLRFFGGYDLASDMQRDRDWVKAAYARAVPMGGDLPPITAGRPTFAVWAVKDPTSGNLDRVQIVKGWSKNGQSFEKVFDVIWSGERTVSEVDGQLPPVGNTVDVAAIEPRPQGTSVEARVERIAEDVRTRGDERAPAGSVGEGMNLGYRNSIGAVELKTVWTDPEFEPGVDAFYYARVLEIPTPRWTTIQARQLGQQPPANVAATLQERAWSSPIWYTPSAEVRKSASQGQTVTDLVQRGAKALTDDEIKALIVSKTLNVRNTVTGQTFTIIYAASGRRLITGIDGVAPEPGEIGDVLHSGEIGAPAGYEIKGGKIITTLMNSPYEVAVYQLGNKYYGARSNEFGFANYEMDVSPTTP
ncbi:DUF3604 domain-containing protein [Microvirga aerophila]|nr:DUF3604 domain-containing protein [Microvirga aerophila]